MKHTWMAGIGIAALAASSLMGQRAVAESAATMTQVALNCPEGTTELVFEPAWLKLSPYWQSVTSPVTVGAGMFEVVTYVSWDGYPERVSVSQPNERWAVRVGTVVTDLTADLPDLVEEATLTGSLAAVEVTGGPIEAVHYSLLTGDDSSPNSVKPVGICYRLSPVPTTTTMPPSTTTTTIPPSTTTIPPSTTTIPPSSTTPPSVTTIPTTLPPIVLTIPTAPLPSTPPPAPAAPTTVAPTTAAPTTAPPATPTSAVPTTAAAVVQGTQVTAPPAAPATGVAVAATAVEAPLAVTGPSVGRQSALGALLVASGAWLVSRQRRRRA
jgi:hypothetical protein